MISRCFHSLYFVSLLLLAVVLIACGEDSETVRVTDRYTLDMLDKGVSLTEETCDAARMGQLLYVGDSSSIYYCTGKAWKKANGKDGKDGRDGKDAEDGVDGKKGENGTSGTDCFAEEFADGIVLGCGATKAIVHYNFEIPDTCSIKRNDDSSYVLTCGKDTTTLLQGPQGGQGATCMQKDMGEGRVNLVCGSDSVTLYKAACGEIPFDPDGLMFCYGDTLVERCNSRTYDIKKQFCYGDTLVDMCGGKVYELKEQFCNNDSLVNLCDGKRYDLTQHFCYGDSLIEMCGGKDYDLTQQFCYGDSLVDVCDGRGYDLAQHFCYGDSLVDMCDGKDYDLTQQFCYGDSLVDVCDGKSYDLAQQFCYGDSLVDMCGDKDYDLTQKFCYGDSVVTLCGGKDYDLNLELCQNNEIAPRYCGGSTYDETLYFCNNNELIDLCSGNVYNVQSKFCYNDSLVDRCGDDSYDLETQFCYNGTRVINLCNGEMFDPYNYVCMNNELFGKCGGERYPIDREFCFAGQIYSLCGQEYGYDPEEFICKDGNILMGLCGGVEYEPADSTCYNGEVVPKCPAELGEKEFCDERNGRVYKYTSIGGQIWMAENLDYRVPEPEISYFENMSHSFCEQRENDYDLYCGAKGRYYPWHVAMAKDVRVCGEGHVCTEAKPQQFIQGICPDGWHLPFFGEWLLLLQTMGNDRMMYWDVSVDDVKYGHGTDPYGFSAVLTGILPYRNDDGTLMVRPSKDVSYPYTASYWSSSEYRGEISGYSSLSTESNVYVVTLDANPAPSTSLYVELRPVMKRNARTVRCVRD